MSVRAATIAQTTMSATMPSTGGPISSQIRLLTGSPLVDLAHQELVHSETTRATRTSSSWRVAAR